MTALTGVVERPERYAKTDNVALEVRFKLPVPCESLPLIENAYPMMTMEQAAMAMTQNGLRLVQQFLGRREHRLWMLLGDVLEDLPTCYCFEVNCAFPIDEHELLLYERARKEAYWMDGPDLFMHIAWVGLVLLHRHATRKV